MKWWYFMISHLINMRSNRELSIYKFVISIKWFITLFEKNDDTVKDIY